MKRHFLTLGLIGACLVGGFGLLAGAETIQPLQPSTPAVKSALTKVITQQLQALHSGDYAKAYTFASSGIRTLVPPPLFESMIKANYAVLINPARTDFGAAIDDGDEGVVFVQVTDAKGGRILFRYVLKSEPDGWKINGVEQAEDASSPGRAPFSA
jgi:hypothetical protein